MENCSASTLPACNALFGCQHGAFNPVDSQECRSQPTMAIADDSRSVIFLRYIFKSFFCPGLRRSAFFGGLCWTKRSVWGQHFTARSFGLVLGRARSRCVHVTSTKPRGWNFKSASE